MSSSSKESLGLRLHWLGVAEGAHALRDWQPEAERGDAGRIRKSQQDLKGAALGGTPGIDEWPVLLFKRAREVVRDVEDTLALAYIQHLLCAGYNTDWQESYADFDGTESWGYYKETLAHVAARHGKPACLAQLLLAGSNPQKAAGDWDHYEDRSKSVAELAVGECGAVVSGGGSQWEARVAEAEDRALRLPRAQRFWLAQLARRRALPMEVADRIWHHLIGQWG
mmetsp:Transcript_40517/g.67684  ORF Transcript_40517/g.67684 Transcript_40517/m.67684 type:complete len:225 (-) Transcript_40517:27-701(-)|eukprot:CAMPEP_0174295464 /NCGR_PEP_ID=MMETSP0809-20121228/44799_1 /TAXON_ID=73025 ORGANISM="Eutreptiella gymnastica-like, Strain CCMP1594" /NCGR_SAMPLE_ID=MMETSP0809 /ASSEMBLY_ACC=CAM_ASM_000658 /LENGTH=224 /DNA_ID=CAMNT_0015397745 /DNA_START=66 /DNA_END=740 /DNA_ORIENTATION=+